MAEALDELPGYIRELVLNAVLILACGWLLRRPDSRWSLDSVLGLRIEPDDVYDDDDPEPDPSIGVHP